MLLDSLFIHASSDPDALAIIDDRGRWTYQQLANMARGFARYLITQARGPRIGVLLPSGSGFAASFYGALLAGKTVVPINFLLSDREIAYCIADSGIDTVVTVAQLAARV